MEDGMNTEVGWQGKPICHVADACCDHERTDVKGPEFGIRAAPDAQVAGGQEYVVARSEGEVTTVSISAACLGALGAAEVLLC